MFVGTTPAYAAPEPLPIASVSPANGAVIPVRPPGLGESSWSLTSIPLLQNVSVIVTLTPATGTDGVRLSDTDLEQFCILNPSGTDVGVYQVNGCTTGSHARWTTVPGTYYWQIWSAWSEIQYNKGPEPGELVYRSYASPIFTITVAYPPPPPMEPAPQSEPTPAPTHPQCAGRRAKIGGRSTCLHTGAACSWRYRKQYARYHYACVRRAGHYRLVRR
jgi:hypothetical protein